MRKQLQSPNAGDHFIFVDVDSATCKAWQKQEHENSRDEEGACTMSSMTPRSRLAAVIDKLNDKVAEKSSVNKKWLGPALVVLDFDLAPAASLSRADDAKLCGSIMRVAAHTPVIVVRPTVIDRVQKRIEGHTSIFDAANTQGSTASPSVPSPTPSCDLEKMSPEDQEKAQRSLWFGSAVVRTDPNGVVRPVDSREWIWVQDKRAGRMGLQKVGSIGLLGGALLTLNKAGNFDALARCFPGSKPQTTKGQSDERCTDLVSDAGTRIQSLLNRQSTTDDAADPPIEIAFSIPLGKKDTGSTFDSPDNLLCDVSAVEMEKSSIAEGCGLTDPLSGAVLVFGGSAVAAGDIHPTPIEPYVPGAMDHVNAIRSITKFLQHNKDRPWLIEKHQDSLSFEIGGDRGRRLYGHNRSLRGSMAFASERQVAQGRYRRDDNPAWD